MEGQRKAGCREADQRIGLNPSVLFSKLHTKDYKEVVEKIALLVLLVSATVVWFDVSVDQALTDAALQVALQATVSFVASVQALEFQSVCAL